MFSYKKIINRCVSTTLGFIAIIAFSTHALAVDVTLIQVSDLHGALLPHPGKIYDTDGNKRYVTQGGGIAKVATVINQIRADADENIVVLNKIKQVAPDAFLHPVHTMRRFLDSLPGNTVTEAQFGLGRVVNVDTTQIYINDDGERVSPEAPLPENAPLPYTNQPIEGFGPDWFARMVN